MSQYIVAQVEEQRAGLYMQRFAVQYSALPGGVLTAVVEHGQREVVEGVVLQLPSSNFNVKTTLHGSTQLCSFCEFCILWPVSQHLFGYT